MTAYEFIPGTADLTQQPGGDWVASFQAVIYSGQSFNEVSNSMNAENQREIVFEVEGDEVTPTEIHPGASAPYTRGTESEVILILTRDGKRKGSIATSYP